MTNSEETKANLIELYFSVLEYMPSIIRGEKINVGIVFHIPSESKVKFVKTSNMQRVKAFDDDNINFYKFVIEQISAQFTFPTIGNVTLEPKDYSREYLNISENNFLLEKTKYYNNKFQFKPVEHVKITTNEIEDYETDLIRTYLYYDRPKSERITTAEVKKLLGKQIKISNSDDVKKDPDVKDDFGLTKIFDYKIDGVYVLTIGFDYKQEAQLAKELKRRLYDLSKLELPINNLKIVVDDLAPNSPVYNKFKEDIEEIAEYKKLNIEIVKVSEFNY